MVITITPGGVGTGTAFTLADDSVKVVTGTAGTGFPNGAGGQCREGFLNKQRRSVQKTPLFRGDYAGNLPRYNWENRFQFTVQRSFQTVEACVAFIAAHPDTVPATGEITLSYMDTSGNIKRYLPNAVVESVDCVKHLAMACDFQYTIAGVGAWQSSP